MQSPAEKVRPQVVMIGLALTCVLLFKVPEFYHETIWESVHAMNNMEERVFRFAGE